MWCLGGSFPDGGQHAQVRWNTASFPERVTGPYGSWLSVG